MKKSLLILWLRFAAWVLDELDKPHNLRRRLGQLQRVRVAASVVADQKLPSLSVSASVAEQKHRVTARFGTKRGGSGMRQIRTAEEAEKIMSGGYGVTTVALECSCSPGEAIGRRWRVDRGTCDDRRLKWAWSFDQDHFTPETRA